MGHVWADSHYKQGDTKILRQKIQELLNFWTRSSLYYDQNQNPFLCLIRRYTYS